MTYQNLADFDQCIEKRGLEKMYGMLLVECFSRLISKI